MNDLDISRVKDPVPELPPMIDIGIYSPITEEQMKEIQRIVTE